MQPLNPSLLTINLSIIVRSHSGNNGFGTIIPIPGSTTEARVIENSKEVTLTVDELKELEEVTKLDVVGARYPAH